MFFITNLVSVVGTVVAPPYRRVRRRRVVRDVASDVTPYRVWVSETVRDVLSRGEPFHLFLVLS